MIEYRKLTHDDYNDIVEISKDIWEGTDYLPELFHQWVDDSKGLFIGAVDHDTGKVIGTDKYSVLYDGTGWLEGLRIHKDYRGRGISKEMAQLTLAHAKEQQKSGKIRTIAFSTHITSVESIGLMTKLGFRLEQQYILVMKAFEKLDKHLSGRNFDVKAWDIDFEAFQNLPYFSKRNNILPLVFYFQKPTPALFEELKEEGCFVCINGHKGLYKFKGEPHFICFDESFEGINTFMNFYLLSLEGKSTVPPLTSVRPEDFGLLEALKASGYSTWNDWKGDYLYFIYP